MERNNNLIVGFNRDALHSIGQHLGVPMRGAVMFTGLDGSNGYVGNPTRNKLSPRLGGVYPLNGAANCAQQPAPARGVHGHRAVADIG